MARLKPPASCMPIIVIFAPTALSIGTKPVKCDFPFMQEGSRIWDLPTTGVAAWDTTTLAMRLVLMGLLVLAPAVPAAMILTDNGNNSQHGFARRVTVSSTGQFNISFTSTLQACGDHIVDLVNDPSGTNPLNPEPPSWEGDPGSSPDSYVWRTCLASELDSADSAYSHNGYLDANMGTSIPRWVVLLWGVYLLISVGGDGRVCEWARAACLYMYSCIHRIFR